MSAGDFLMIVECPLPCFKRQLSVLREGILPIRIFGFSNLFFSGETANLIVLGGAFSKKSVQKKVVFISPLLWLRVG